ncbi:hypothetical protein [Pseudonocardia acaciae]|uniref:hypothetical protein n=1 Tax=Pseudonocardia acaciae TaxID=551276 RepID=UPI00048E7749|nr:hypothetical protein [Pseudonocardia acaciae]
MLRTQPNPLADLNAQLRQAVTATSRHRQLAICAHEIGHALLELAGGGDVRYVELRFKLTGLAGYCHYGDDAHDAEQLGWSGERKLARQIATMAGHAAEVRFCQHYLGMDHSAAFRYGLDWAEGDYTDFYYFRRKFGLRHISPDWAFHRAGIYLDRHGGLLDRLTLRLHHAHHVNGGAFPPPAGVQ